LREASFQTPGDFEEFRASATGEYRKECPVFSGAINDTFYFTIPLNASLFNRFSGMDEGYRSATGQQTEIEKR